MIKKGDGRAVSKFSPLTMNRPSATDFPVCDHLAAGAFVTSTNPIATLVILDVVSNGTRAEDVVNVPINAVVRTTAGQNCVLHKVAEGRALAARLPALPRKQP